MKKKELKALVGYLRGRSESADHKIEALVSDLVTNQNSLIQSQNNFVDRISQVLETLVLQTGEQLVATNNRIEALQQELVGLRTENNRILEYLLGEQPPEPPEVN